MTRCCTSKCTPYEAIHGMKPIVSHFRMFASRAFVYLPSGGREEKLDVRSAPGVLVGYTIEDTFKILLIDSRIVKTKHVTFDESYNDDTKPFRELTSSSSIFMTLTSS